jgi:hypothetical protein
VTLILPRKLVAGYEHRNRITVTYPTIALLDNNSEINITKFANNGLHQMQYIFKLLKLRFQHSALRCLGRSTVSSMIVRGDSVEIGQIVAYGLMIDAWRKSYNGSKFSFCFMDNCFKVYFSLVV